MSTVKTVYELLSKPLLADLADLKARWDLVKDSGGDFNSYRDTVKKWLVRDGFQDVAVIPKFHIAFSYLGSSYGIQFHDKISAYIQKYPAGDSAGSIKRIMFK